MNILRFIQKDRLKEWFYGIVGGAATGGTCGFGLGVTSFYPDLSSKYSIQRMNAVEKVEKSTIIGSVVGGLLVSSVCNPLLSGGVFLVSTVPIYMCAKFKKDENSIRYYR